MGAFYWTRRSATNEDDEAQVDVIDLVCVSGGPARGQLAVALNS